MAEDIQKFIMTIITIAMVLTIGLIILGQFRDTMGDDISSTSVVNESVTSVTNATLKALANTGFTLSCTEVRNSTGNWSAVDITNAGANGSYTCGPSGITFTDLGLEMDGNLYVDYNYKVGNAQYNATGSNISKLSTIPTWIGILITVVLAFIVLGYFYSRRN